MPSSGARSVDSTLATRSEPRSSIARQSVKVPPRPMKKSKGARRGRALVEQARVRHALRVHASQIEADRAVFCAHDHMPAVLELPKQELVAERLFDLVLDQPRERAGAVRLV